MSKEVKNPNTIHFSLKDEYTVVNNTVKLVASITGMIGGETTEENLRNDIRAIMKKIADVNWQFSNMTRIADPSGLERVTVIASARVNETENYNLQNRALQNSRKGLTINQITADTSVPQAMIDEAQKILRHNLITMAMNELKEINTLTGTTYQLHDINFNPMANAFSNSNNRASVAMATIAKQGYGSGFGGDDESDALGNASKLSMEASIVLANFS